MQRLDTRPLRICRYAVILSAGQAVPDALTISSAMRIKSAARRLSRARAARPAWGKTLSLLTRIAKSGRAGFSIRAYVAAVVLAMMAPTLMITWWVTSSSAASERRQLEQNAEAQ